MKFPFVRKTKTVTEANRVTESMPIANYPRLSMNTKFSKTSSRGRTPLATIHGFRVQSYGKRLSPGFKRGLRRLAERDFDDPACVVVKTTSGNRSGITHAGGRYVHPDNPSVKIGLLPGVRAEDVRTETYPLFTAGIRSAADLPPVPPGRCAVVCPSWPFCP